MDAYHAIFLHKRNTEELLNAISKAGASTMDGPKLSLIDTVPEFLATLAAHGVMLKASVVTEKDLKP